MDKIGGQGIPTPTLDEKLLAQLEGLALTLGCLQHAEKPPGLLLTLFSLLNGLSS